MSTSLVTSSPSTTQRLVALERVKAEGNAILEAIGDRTPTPDEQRRLNDHAAHVRRLQTELSRVADEADLAAQMDAFATGVPSRVPLDAFAHAVLKSPFGQYVTEHRGELRRSSPSWSTPPLDLSYFGGGDSLRAAVITSDLPAGGSLIFPDVRPGIVEVPTRRLVVADLLGRGMTSSNAVAYMRESAIVNAAAAVAEGTTKPESTITFAATTEPVRKIATWIPVSDEVLEDVPGFVAYINSRLRHFVLLAEDAQLLTGDGVAPNFLGLLNRSGLAPSVARAAGENNGDAILRQIAAIETSTGESVSGIIMNPANYTALRLAKNLQGSYLCGGGPCSAPAAQTLWGYSVVTTPAMPAGTALVGAFQTACEWRLRTPVRIVASNSHADFFIKNLVALVAEERGALVVFREAAIGTVTNLDPTSPPPPEG